MKSFIVNIRDGIFEAEDIDNAFQRLADYFRALALFGCDAETIFDAGVEMKIEPFLEKANNE